METPGTRDLRARFAACFAPERGVVATAKAGGENKADDGAEDETEGDEEDTPEVLDAEVSIALEADDLVKVGDPVRYRIVMTNDSPADSRFIPQSLILAEVEDPEHRNHAGSIDRREQSPGPRYEVRS